MMSVEVVDKAAQEAAAVKAVEIIRAIDAPMTERLRLQLVAEQAIRCYVQLQEELGFRADTEQTL